MLFFKVSHAATQKDALSVHATQVFDANLLELSRALKEMSGVIEDQIVEVIRALSSRNRDSAQAVVNRDTIVDSLQRDIETRAIAILAQRQAAASDLRQAVSMLRISSELERIGDLAKNIGKRVIDLRDEILPEILIAGLTQMAGLVLEQFRRVIDSYTRCDASSAYSVWNSDEEIDRFHNTLFVKILSDIVENAKNISSCTHLLFCTKNLERMGDHATNIAEAVYYAVKGQRLSGARPKCDTTSFKFVSLPGLT